MEKTSLHVQNMGELEPSQLLDGLCDKIQRPHEQDRCGFILLNMEPTSPGALPYSQNCGVPRTRALQNRNLLPNTAQDDICNTGVEEPFKQCILPTEDECSECEQIIGWAPSVHPNLDPEMLWEKWSSTIILSRDADLRLLRNYPSRPLKRSRLRGPHQGGSQLLVYLAHHLGV